VRIRLIVVGNAGWDGEAWSCLDAPAGVAVENRGVLRVGDSSRRIDERLQLGVFRSTLDRVHLFAQELEIRPQLDEGQRLPPGRPMSAIGALPSGSRAQCSRRRGGPAARRIHELSAASFSLRTRVASASIDFHAAVEMGRAPLQIVHSPGPPSGCRCEGVRAPPPKSHCRPSTRPVCSSAMTSRS